MATCLTYVQGSAKAPTPDCCAGQDDVNKKDRKCLCLLIKDSSLDLIPFGALRGHRSSRQSESSKGCFRRDHR